MKKLNAKDLKSIKGGDWRYFCRRQCISAYQACIASGQAGCDDEAADCLAGCI
jgi:bacteriocin-like protein